MRTRVVVTLATIAALVGFGMLVRLWFAGPTATDDRVFAGSYTSDTDLRVGNLTIGGGHVRVGYSFDVLFEPEVQQNTEEPGTLRCGLVDTSGRLDFFGGSQLSARSGVWTHLEFDAPYELPELTLGIRCSPSADGVASVAFRGIRIFEEKIAD